MNVIMASKFHFAFLLIILCGASNSFSDDRLVQQLITRIASLERQGNVHVEQLSQQATDIKDLRTRVKNQEEALRQRDIMLKNCNQQSTDKTAGSVSVSTRAGPVAFHALLMAPDITNLTVGQIIVFPAVMVNIGNNFNSTSGVFTSSVAGVYIFSLTLEASPHVYVEVSIQKNGNVLAYAFASGYRGDEVYDQGSVTVVTQLDAGDRVWPSLYNPPNTSLFGHGFSSFMGSLITTS